MDVIMPAMVDEYSFGGWFIALWVCGPFEEEKAAPLAHSVIREFKGVLGASSPVDLQMPDFDASDIIAEAPLTWRGQTYQMVVNTSDGVVAIRNPRREPLDELLATIAKAIHIVA